MKSSIDSCTTTVDLHKPKRQKATHIISANNTASHGDVNPQFAAGANEQSNMASLRLREDIPHDYVIDEHGDLTLRLIYDGTTTDVQVCSRTLARSCKFFSILLYGPYKESYSELRTRRWVVVMEELEPEILVQILRVLHLHDTTEMRSLSGMQINDVLCMLDYLGCEKPFGDLAYAWEATIQKEASKNMKVANDRLLYAALYLGLKECFVEMMNKLQEQANNTDFWMSTSASTSTTILKHKDMSLRFRNNKPMELDPMLQPFGLVEQLKDRRDSLWAIQQDKKQKGLELYDKRLGQYLPNKDAGKRSRANRVQEIALGPAPSPDATAHVAIQYRLCVELQREGMPSENFQWANHQAGSLLNCFKKLRGIYPFLPLEGDWRSLRARRMETELDKLQRAYVSTAIKYDKFDLPKCLEEFLESRRKRFGTWVPFRSTRYRGWRSRDY